MSQRSLRIAVLSIAVLMLIGAGCKKKPPPAPPPPPPPPAMTPEKPTATLRANPSSIERGQSTTLTWSTTNADTVMLEPSLGQVQPNGSQRLSPAQSITYRIVAHGKGGDTEATARVTVTNPPPPPTPPPPATEKDIDTLWMETVKPIYFDYDKSDIRDDQKAALEADGRFFQAHSDAQVSIEGNCDERGSAEYNLGLGDRRANSIKEFLVAMGISADRLHTISYGKEKPTCTESNESCWQQNRRGDLKHKK